MRPQATGLPGAVSPARIAGSFHARRLHVADDSVLSIEDQKTTYAKPVFYDSIVNVKLGGQTMWLESRKYIVGVVAVALLLWGPLDHSWPAWWAIRTGYLILIPLATWHLLGWIFRTWQPDPQIEQKLKTFISANKDALLAIAVVVMASCAGTYFIAPLYVELQISLFGREAKATIVKVETVERDDGDRAWTVDLINYKFEIPDGYVFTGVNDANSSETEGLIGSGDMFGNYPEARVEYVHSHPEWHRLKGWGYGGLGPPGSIPWLIFRMCIVIGPVLFAYFYAYELICQHAKAVPSARRNRQSSTSQ